MNGNAIGRQVLLTIDLALLGNTSLELLLITIREYNAAVSSLIKLSTYGRRLANSFLADEQHLVTLPVCRSFANHLVVLSQFAPALRAKHLRNLYAEIR